MMRPKRPRLTKIIKQAEVGDSRAESELWNTVYNELKALARRRVPRSAGDTLRPTALVNEAFLRLGNSAFANTDHFYALACSAMRCIVVDYARAASAAKRGAGATKVALDDHLLPKDAKGDDMLALDEALKKLEEKDPPLAELVVLRYFGGLTLKEIAKMRGISEATAKRDWSAARLWLRNLLK